MVANCIKLEEFYKFYSDGKLRFYSYYRSYLEKVDFRVHNSVRLFVCYTTWGGSKADEGKGMVECEDVGQLVQRIPGVEEQNASDDEYEQLFRLFAVSN